MGMVILKIKMNKREQTLSKPVLKLVGCFED